MNKKLEDALNKQMNAELYSAYLYYSMSAYFSALNLNGMASWMNAQTLEELSHVGKFNSYIVERGGRVVLSAIEAPPAEWDSPLAVFKESLKHERKVTGLINGLVDLAIQESDHASNAFLQWFVNEQVEEEATVDGIVQNLKLIGKDGHGLFMIDQQVGQRVFTPPPASAE